jgi:hypothetical protein
MPGARIRLQHIAKVRRPPLLLLIARLQTALNGEVSSNLAEHGTLAANVARQMPQAAGLTLRDERARFFPGATSDLKRPEGRAS